MKAIRYQGPHHVSVEEVPIPHIPEGWVLIQVSHAGICGSDMTIYAGKHPRAKAPLTLGHEFSGYVRSPNSRFPEGTPVTVYPYLSCGTCRFCRQGDGHICENLRLIGIDLDGGMAEYAAVPESSLYPIPSGISRQLAAFIEPVGIAVHAVRKGGWKQGQNAVIFGAGAIGLLCAMTLRRFGAEQLLVVEPDPTRSRFAAELGFETAAPGEDGLEAVLRWSGGKGADFVFDCAGHPSVAAVLPDAARINGQIVIVAGYKNPPTVDFQKGMFRELTIQFVRNCSRQDFETACELIDETYERILNCILPLEDAQTGFDSPKGVYKVMFRISEEGRV